MSALERQPAEDVRLHDLAQDLADELAAFVEQRGGDSPALLAWERYRRQSDGPEGGA